MNKRMINVAWKMQNVFTMFYMIVINTSFKPACYYIDG